MSMNPTIKSNSDQVLEQSSSFKCFDYLGDNQ